MGLANIPNQAKNGILLLPEIGQEILLFSCTWTPRLVTTPDPVVHFGPVCRIMDDAFLPLVVLLHKDRQR